MQINYDEFINNLKILHSDTINDFTSGLQFLIDSQSDAISYNQTKQFSLLNVSVLEKNNNRNYFYDITLDREGDILNNFNLESKNKNIKLNFIIGGKIYEMNEINELIIVASPYSDFKIRITFLEKPNIDDEFKISYRVYLLESDIRRNFMNNPIKTETNIYIDGVFR